MFKIGEFSKLTHISIRMLRHYDDINLLTPNRIDDFTGYRYYSYNQLIIANQIQSLKSMGISLKDIKDIIRDYDDSNKLKDYLNNHKLKMLKELDNLNNKISLIENSLNNLDKGVLSMKYNVVIKEIPKRQIASVRNVISNYSEEGKLWGILHQEIASQNPKFANPPYNLAIYHDEEYKEYNPDVEIQTTVIGDYTNTENVEFKIIDEVKVASVMMKGSYEQIADINIEATRWILENGYEFDGKLFSIYHVGPKMESNPENWLTELCYPVKKVK